MSAGYGEVKKMAFCMECGTRLPDGAKFCINCGTPVKNSGRQESSERTIPVSNEKILKCPNCNSNISRLDAVCPYCGAQITDRKASASVQRFAEQLNEIENYTPKKNEKKSLFAFNFDPLGYRALMERTKEVGYGDEKFERKISLISSFPIPNTIEEITEFVILAANSIDPQWGKDNFHNRWYGKPGMAYYTEIKLATTWINKLNQAYDKARITFPNDPMFQKLEKIYRDKMKELNRDV